MPNHYDDALEPNCIKHRMPDGTEMSGPPHGEHQTCIEWDDGTPSMVTDHELSEGGRTAPVPAKKNAGGVLKGPSHEQGGIPAIVGGQTPVELEGGEYIINAQTVDAVGQEFLDELNSTQTSHHQGGFQQGQLPSPSQFKNGGRVNNRRNSMARGRRAPAKRRGGTAGRAPARKTMARGGRPAKRNMRTGGCPPGTIMSNGGCTPAGGQAAYRKGGRTKPRPTGRGRQMANGGMTKSTRGGRPTPRRMVGGGALGVIPCKNLTGALDCNNKNGCSWNPSTGMCH